MSDELGNTEADKVSVPKIGAVGSSGSRDAHHPPRVARSIFGEAGAPTGEQIPRQASRSVSSQTGTNHSRFSKHPGAPKPRRMNLSLVRFDAWSVAKVTFLLAVAGGIVQIIATGLIWALLNAVGVFDQISRIFSSTGLDAGSVNLTDIFSLSTVLSAVTIFSIIEVVIFTLLATIFALLYNAVSALVGGVHVTLGDD